MDRQPIDVSPGGIEPDRGEIKERARRIGEAARHRALSTIDQKKQTLASKLNKVLARVETGARDPETDKVVSRLAGSLRKLQRKLETRSAGDLLDEAERQMRARPGLTLLAGLALGFLGARLVRG